MKKIILLFVIIVLISVYQIRKWTVQNGPLSNVVNVIIPKGAGLKTVTNELIKNGVINEPWLFMVNARIRGFDKKLRAGEYQFSPQVSILDVLHKISHGDVYLRKITIPEGLSTGQIIYLISSQSHLTGEITIDVKEGELLPETYTFEHGAHRNVIIKQAKNAMKKAIKDAWNARDDNLPIKTPEEMLVLASIIEKETAVASERDVVSSVFVNRLRKRMRLQTDPTVIYAVTEGLYELERSLKKADLRIESPYNTYRNYGLPPGPICNPGVEALFAAVNPASTDYLYFVATGTGGHNFATNLKQHNSNVRSWLKKIRRR